jgi:hypothetical protein
MAESLECHGAKTQITGQRLPKRLDFLREWSVHAAQELMGNTSVIAFAWSFDRALGGGSAGNGPVASNGGSHVKHEHATRRNRCGSQLR